MNNPNGDIHDLRGGVPIIGAPMRAKIGTQLSAFVRALDDDGTITVPVINGPKGPLPSVPRGAFMDAEQLIEAIAKAVEEKIKPLREEIRVLRNKLNRQDDAAILLTDQLKKLND